VPSELKGLNHGKYCHLDFTPPPQESLSWGASYYSGAAPKLQNHEHIEGDLRIALNDSMSGRTDVLKTQPAQGGFSAFPSK
jgi:hypothetical protein